MAENLLFWEDFVHHSQPCHNSFLVVHHLSKDNFLGNLHFDDYCSLHRQVCKKDENNIQLTNDFNYNCVPYRKYYNYISNILITPHLIQ